MQPDAAHATRGDVDILQSELVGDALRSVRRTFERVFEDLVFDLLRHAAKLLGSWWRANASRCSTNRSQMECNSTAVMAATQWRSGGSAFVIASRAVLYRTHATSIASSVSARSLSRFALFATAGECPLSTVHRARVSFT